MAGMPYPPNLCPSVQSVGEYLASETSVGSVVSVGRHFGGCVGMAGMPYPPTIAQTGVGDSSKKVCGTITFLLLLHQIIRHDTLAYDRLNSIIVNK